MSSSSSDSDDAPLATLRKPPQVKQELTEEKTPAVKTEEKANQSSSSNSKKAVTGVKRKAPSTPTKAPAKKKTPAKKAAAPKKKPAVKKEPVKPKYELPGQRRPTPEPLNCLRMFYEHVYSEDPGWEHAEKWLLHHGLFPMEKAVEIAAKYSTKSAASRKRKTPAVKRKASVKRKTPVKKKTPVKRKAPVKRRRKVASDSSSDDDDDDDSSWSSDDSDVPLSRLRKK